MFSVSTRADYGLIVMFELATRPEKDFVSLADMCVGYASSYAKKHKTSVP